MSEFSDKSLEKVTFEDLSHHTIGETPKDIHDKCLKVCAEYLGGSWNGITSDQLIVRRICGGLTNQLYFCGLAQAIAIMNDEPKEVVVKFYGEKYFNTSEKNERLSDMVIALLASQHNLGPKLYAIFNEGVIQEYIECHQFRIEDQNNPVLVRELSKMMAQFHSLNAPLPKHVNWIETNFNDFYQKAYEHFPINHILKEVKAENLIKRNIKEEYEWLLKCMKATNSPIVVSHNDFRGSNLLVHEMTDDNNTRLITLCDFDYSCYNYRGFDLGMCLHEFGQTIISSFEEFPSDQVLEAFLRGYLDESIRIHGEEFGLNQQNSMEQLVKETKIFALGTEMLSILFLFQAKDIVFTSNKSDIMIGANLLFGNYLERKRQFESEGIFPIPQ